MRRRRVYQVRHTDNILEVASSRHRIGRVNVQRAKVLSELALLFDRHVVLLAEKDDTAFSHQAGAVVSAWPTAEDVDIPAA